MITHQQQSKSRWLPFWLMALLSLFATSIIVVVSILAMVLTYKNVRLYTVGGLVAEAKISKGEPRYHRLRIQTNSESHGAIPEIKIRLPNSAVVNWNQLTEDMLIDIHQRYLTEPDHVRFHPKGAWPFTTRGVYLGKYRFFVDKGRVIGLEVDVGIGSPSYGGGSHPPAIALAHSPTLEELPLSESQLKSIFGDAEKIEEILRE